MGDSLGAIAPYPGFEDRFVDMCSQCRLATPKDADQVCHACSIAIRAETRRGLRAIEEHLGDWAQLERWLDDWE